MEAGISRGKYRFRLQGVIREREETADDDSENCDSRGRNHGVFHGTDLCRVFRRCGFVQPQAGDAGAGEGADRKQCGNTCGNRQSDERKGRQSAWCIVLYHFYGMLQNL